MRCKRDKVTITLPRSIDAFGGNPSFYDNGYNMSSTFYNRPPTKKFGTVQEKPKNMSRLLNSSKNKSGLVWTMHRLWKFECKCKDTSTRESK